MTEDQIKQIVNSYIKQSIEGLEKENPKLDFKRNWYDLKTTSGINEFLKDTSAIANSFGLDGYIIIGYDEKDKSFRDTFFSECGLRDSSDLMNLIIKKVDSLFHINYYDIQIDNHSLSVLHIPPSIDKPHVIKLYQTLNKDGTLRDEQNRVFVRKISGTFPASKHDLELMYYDRKNVIPEYKIYSNYHINSVAFNVDSKSRIILTFHLTLENVGRRPVAINSIRLKIHFDHNPDNHDIIYLNTLNSLHARNILIKSGEIWNGSVTLFSIPFEGIDIAEKKQELAREKNNLMHKPIEFRLANGEVITSELIKQSKW